MREKALKLLTSAANVSYIRHVKAEIIQTFMMSACLDFI